MDDGDTRTPAFLYRSCGLLRDAQWVQKERRQCPECCLAHTFRDWTTSPVACQGGRHDDGVRADGGRHGQPRQLAVVLVEQPAAGLVPQYDSWDALTEQPCRRVLLCFRCQGYERRHARKSEVCRA